MAGADGLVLRRVLGVAAGDPASKCRFCAMPWGGDPDPDFVCGPACADPLPVDWTEAWGCYRGSLERVLHAFKFKRHDFFADPLAELVERMIRARGDLDFDAVVPVPMHRAQAAPPRLQPGGAPRPRAGAAPRHPLRDVAADEDARPRRAIETAARRARRQRARCVSRIAARERRDAHPARRRRLHHRRDDPRLRGELVRAGAARVAAAVVAKTE